MYDPSNSVIHYDIAWP